jgi:hypothetical protein
MAWIFATVVLLLMVYVPRFRVVIAWALGVATFLGLGLWGYYTWSENSSRKLIKPTELAFEDLRLTTLDSHWSLRGRVRNNSRIYTLSSIAMNVSIRDCVSTPLTDSSTDPDEELSRIKRDLLGPPPSSHSGPAKCDVVGQQEVRMANLKVPAGQVREIEESIYFSSGTKVRNTMEWSYQISSIAGR